MVLPATGAGPPRRTAGQAAGLQAGGRPRLSAAAKTAQGGNRRPERSSAGWVARAARRAAAVWQCGCGCGGGAADEGRQGARRLARRRQNRFARRQPPRAQAHTARLRLRSGTA